MVPRALDFIYLVYIYCKSPKFLLYILGYIPIDFPIQLKNYIVLFKSTHVKANSVYIIYVFWGEKRTSVNLNNLLCMNMIELQKLVPG